MDQIGTLRMELVTVLYLYFEFLFVFVFVFVHFPGRNTMIMIERVALLEDTPGGILGESWAGQAARGHTSYLSLASVAGLVYIF